jgi:exonuclease SbcC
LQQELQKTKDSFQKASNDVAKAVEALGAANQNAESAQLTLETRAHYRTLRKLWNDEWQERCVLLVEEESRFGVEVVELAKGEQTFGNNQAAHEVKLKEHVERTQTLLAEPQTRVRASAEQLVALTHGELPVEKRGALRRTFEELQALVEQTRVAERELGELDTMDKEVARATAEFKGIESSVTLTNTEALRLREQASHAAERQRDAETQAYRLELIGHIATKRGALRHGEACPLCGSVEHPYVTQPEHCPDDTTIQNQISNARIELARRTEEARGAEVVARDAEQLASGRKQALDGAERLRQTLGEKLRMRVAVVTETLRRAQLPVDCGRAFCNEQLTARCERLEEIKNALVELEAVIDESVCAEREVVKVENELRQEANVLEAERLALFEQSRTLVERREKLFSAKRTLNEGRESLKMALLPFVVELSQSGGAGDVSSFRLTDYKQRVEALIELLKEAELCDEQAKSRQREAALRVEVAEQARKNAEERLADAQRQELEQRAICQELCKQGQELRNKIFGIWATRKYGATEERTQPEPKNSAEVLERAKVLFEQLAEVAAQARLVAEEASTKEAALRGELGILSQSREELQNQLGDAQVKLTAFLDSLALGSVEALRERWMNSDAFQAGRERISRLVQREHDWMTRREERQNAVERHELARPDGFVILDGPEFATSLRAAVTESSLLYNEATERERTRVLYLSELEQRAHAFSTAGERLRQAESAARPWLTLNSLIGTNEGNAFRQFAQGLNLHRLIQKANVHLRRLSERYRLTQAKNGEELTLEFAIIDRWQVGEPRSTRSLSGGERFLVSLALALGLSDLRTHTLPIETLLLDEGFGTLDPETLETALAALQCLQVDGRQVGVISHVAGLKERILAQVRIVEEGTGRSRIVV